MQLNVTDTRIDRRSGTSKAGRPYTMFTQQARLTYANGEVRNVEIQHEDGDLGVQPGTYEPNPEAFYHGKYGPEVSMKARNWKLVKAAPVAKVA